MIHACYCILLTLVLSYVSGSHYSTDWLGNVQGRDFMSGTANYLLYLPLCSAKFASLFWYFPIQQWATLHNLRWSYAIITFSFSLFLSAGILCDLVNIDLQPDAFLCSINDVKVSTTVDQRARNIITGAEVSSSSVVLIGLLQSFQQLSCFFSFFLSFCVSFLLFWVSYLFVLFLWSPNCAVFTYLEDI